MEDVSGTLSWPEPGADRFRDSLRVTLIHTEDDAVLVSISTSHADRVRRVYVPRSYVALPVEMGPCCGMHSWTRVSRFIADQLPSCGQVVLPF